ncbi:hypothetical protein LTR56_027421 [Elasticomyces elasticus]|nr:hypothetical protein LTR56_027421 [Elasticomyces elasticus]KAK4896857.1 hypothetical protein LTR49_028084 [Elasticomyces elasticus]KAK5733214.1 hypothetical protein LTS12_026988 [Elasticomyces elasticus]
MALTVIPNPLFLPFEAVRLGRIVTNIDQPSEGYHEPFSAEPPTSIVSEFNYAGHNQEDSRATFGSTLTSLLSAAFNKRSKSEIRMEPRCCKAYALDNSDAWIDRAIGHEKTRQWIERAAIRGSKMFLIVGICTLTDTRFLQTSVKEQGSQGQVTVPVSLSLAAAGAVVPLAGLVDPSAHGSFARFASNGTRIFAPGEQVCAVQYREIGYKWLSSRVIENVRLSKTRQWSCTEGNRRNAYDSEDEDDEYVIKVDIKDTENMGSGWDAVESEEGVIYIRP